jgi:hypothetical protein
VLIAVEPLFVVGGSRNYRGLPVTASINFREPVFLEKGFC